MPPRLRLITLPIYICANDLETLHRNLKPGGWAEFLDFDLIHRSDDGSLTKDNQILVNCVELVKAAEKLGQDGRPGPKLKKWAEDAGFINVKERVYKIPIGPWAKNPKLVRFPNVYAFPFCSATSG